MDGWVGGWMDEWMDGCVVDDARCSMSFSLKFTLCVCVLCVCVCSVCVCAKKF